jgi:hypothetical protein
MSARTPTKATREAIRSGSSRAADQTVGSLGVVGEARLEIVGPLRGAIRELCANGPVLLAVETCSGWTQPSAAVLTFAWRRLRRARRAPARAQVGQPGHRRLLEGQPVERVKLGPLSLGAIHRLLHSRLELVLPRPVLRCARETAAGNPFFALELGRAVGRRDAPASPAEPLHVPKRLHELVRERLAALSQPTLPLVAAAGGDEPASTCLTPIGRGRAGGRRTCRARASPRSRDGPRRDGRSISEYYRKLINEPTHRIAMRAGAE